MKSSRSSALPPTPLKPTKAKTPASPSISTRTPDKPYSTRLRNRNVALSLKDVRSVARGGLKGQPKTSPVDTGGRSARKLLAFRKNKCASSGGSVESEIAKMDEKYEMLCEFFDSLDNSIRLLRLKGSKCSFTNICSKVESLTDRRFNYRHLAQLKYVMPEVIELKRVLVFDERTSCMKPDLLLSVNIDAIELDEKSKSESKNLHLRKVFRARLLDFANAHPEGDEVPEESLPEPFNTSETALKKHLTASSPVTDATATEPTENHQPAMPSHFAQSFRKHFSSKIAINKDEISSPNSPFAHHLDISAVESVTLPSFAATPVKDTNRENAIGRSSPVQSTPAKLSSISSPELMSSTPAMPPQKRCYMTPDDDSTRVKDKLVRRAPRTRLKFQDPTETDASNDDFSRIIDEKLLQSIREKERKAKEEQDPAISQAKRRRQMISCLPKLFNMIHFLFQSMQKSVITKEELVQKIISGHLDIVDKREVEEQLNLLLELVPEWISEKLASTGDFLLRINKMSNAESIRAQLEAAK